MINQPPQPQPQYYQPPPLRPIEDHSVSKGVALACFILGILFGIGGLIPFLGFILGLISLCFLCVSLVAMLVGI